MATAMWTVQREHSVNPVFPSWPPPVKAAQRMLDFEWEVDEDHQLLTSYLPDQHRLFHSSNIAFLPLAVKDSDGRVWTSMLAQDGLPGFIASPDPLSLIVNAKLWHGDPAERILVDGSEQLVAGVGVELSTRRRNKLAGHVKVSREGAQLKLSVSIDQSLGNCPKYISIRALHSHTDTKPVVELEALNLTEADVLPPAVVDFILARDTLFLSTSFKPTPAQAAQFPAHLGTNHRGGRPGFVRYAGQRTIVIPDYSGNRHMSSLGNILSDPHVGVTFADFKTGDVLYLTGNARNLANDDAAKIMPRTKMLTMVDVTGYTLVRDAMPVREDPERLEASPYSPPVRLLASEQAGLVTVDDNVKARLVAVNFHKVDSTAANKDAELATFTFEATSDLKAKPGQYVVLELLSLIGQQSYRHMSRGDEALVNEDGVRTWTMSAIPTPASPRTFSITVRNVATGRISPRLFSFGSYLQSKWQEASAGSFTPKMELSLLGVGGGFVLPEEPGPLILLAGGVGITPSLAFIRAIGSSAAAPATPWHVDLLVSTREPSLIVDLVRHALSTSSSPAKLDLTVHVFTSAKTPDTELEGAKLIYHSGRLSDDVVKQSVEAAGKSAQVFLCGPPAFEAAAETSLKTAGIGPDRITKESFNY